ncbi:nuclear factor interleukin-3-regulated protein-like isoform X2 [Protopterus annectens]|nr:nuclear factor interleukin-3-regulated protein-like isoform X2 [Protopterus annectens]XP_043940584.1 nuclear factor interleukin-3-regulated protein-like isoform X2 [Protopterus annectens]
MSISAAETVHDMRDGIASQSSLLQELVTPSQSLEMCRTGLSFTEEAVSLLTTNSILARSLLGHNALKQKEAAVIRRKREFIPSEKKDDGYWDKRKKNNEAAKRSREKRRLNDMVLENRVISLLEENARLKAELLALKFRFGLIKDLSESKVVHPVPQPPNFAPLQQTTFPGRNENGFHPPPVDNRDFASNNNREFASNHQNFGRMTHTQEQSVLSEDSGFSTPGSSSVGSPVFFDDRMSDHGKFSPQNEEHCFEGQLCTPSDTEECSGTTSCETTRFGRHDTLEAVKGLPYKLRFKMASGVEETEPEADMKHQKALQERQAKPNTPAHHASDTFSNGHYCNATGQQVARGVSVGVVQPTWRTQAGFMPEELRGIEQSRYSEDTARFSTQGCTGFTQTQMTPVAHQDSYYQSENALLKNQLASLSSEVAQLKKLFSEQILHKVN